jgi:hypothetical protein
MLINKRASHGHCLMRRDCVQGKGKEALTGVQVTARGSMMYELAGKPHITRPVPLAAPLLEHLVRHGVPFGAAEVR